MKLESNNLQSLFNEVNIKNLAMKIKQVDETLDLEFKKEIKKVFSRADLWNIHRQRRNTIVRRFY